MRQYLIFEFDENPTEQNCAGRDGILWRGRLYDRDYTDHETPDDSLSAKPGCVVSNDGTRFKPAADQSLQHIADLYRVAAAQEPKP